MKVHVLLVDGRRLFREGIRALLERRSELTVVGEADDAAAAVKLVEALTPEVVIFNPAPPTRVAADALKMLKAAADATGTRTSVILLTVHSEPSFFREVLEAGASACLTKESASEDLINAIRTVRAGHIYLSPAIADAVVAGYVTPKAKNRADQLLSSRELEILRRIADGESTRRIAHDLAVSTKTIETYRRRVMEKLRLRTIAELTKYAVREGLTSIERQA
jgi:DNA-binding NarL/FixJ family response regulator